MPTVAAKVSTPPGLLSTTVTRTNSQLEEFGASRPAIVAVLPVTDRQVASVTVSGLPFTVAVPEPVAFSPDGPLTTSKSKLVEPTKNVVPEPIT